MCIPDTITLENYGAGCMKILLLLAVLVLRSPMAAQSDPFIATIERAKLAIIPVACSSSDREVTPQTIKIWGTGFFVNFEGDFVTAAHVITDHFKWNAKGEPDPNCLPIIYLPDPRWPAAKWFKFERCVTDTLVDIAVCRTQQNPVEVPRLHLLRLHLVTTSPPDGTSVALTGFPLDVAIPVTSRGSIASSIGAFTGSQPEIMVNGAVWGGMSGGPLYLAHGSVIGMILKTGLPIAAGMGFARPTSSILDFLRKNKVAILEEQQQSKEKK